MIETNKTNEVKMEDTTQIRIIKEISKLERIAAEYSVKAQDYRLLFQQKNNINYEQFAEMQKRYPEKEVELSLTEES